MKIKRKERLVRYFDEQAGLCAYCGDEMTLKLNRLKTAEIEHVVPKSKGGKSGYFNEVAACRECNQEKSNKPLLIFLLKSNRL